MTGVNIPTTIHPNLTRLRNSSQSLLHSCPRKYELEKLLPDEVDWDSQEDIDLGFGSLVGIGVADYAVHGSIDHAIFTTFLACTTDLDYHTTENGMRDGKTFWHALNAISRFSTFYQAEFANQYEIAYFDGKPAIELSGLLDCGGGFTSQFHADIVLKNRRTGVYLVCDAKSTKYRPAEAQWRHNAQCLAYSLMVDTIAEAGKETFEVAYLLYNSKTQEWEKFQYIKTPMQRAKWIRLLLRDMQHIAEYAEDGFFPQHGESCYNFFRPCKYLDICDFDNSSIFGNKTPVVKVDKEEYQFKFTLEQMIEKQLERE